MAEEEGELRTPPNRGVRFTCRAGEDHRPFLFLVASVVVDASYTVILLHIYFFNISAQRH